MKRRTLFWQIFPLLAAISVVLPVWLYFSGRQTLKEAYDDEMTEALKGQAAFLAESAAGPLERGDTAALDALAKRLGKATGTRITVILPSGKVVAESHEDPQRMDDHRSRPEIAAALRTLEPKAEMRRSVTLHEPFLYVAWPIVREGKVAAVIRTARSVAAMQEIEGGLEQRILLAAVLGAGLALAAGWFLARRIVQPLEILTKGAARFGGGDLDHRIPLIGSREIAALAGAMNDMAAQLRDQIQTIVRQQNEQEIVFHGVIEGVLTLDTEGRILDLNEAAEKMFRVEAAKVRGRFVHEVLRRPRLLNFVERIVSDGLPHAEELTIYDKQLRYFTAYGGMLRNARNEPVGVVVMLRDMTQLRELENVRRDFVANASHELRTPLTSIKGFVETLREDGLDDKEHAGRFLQIILDETNRLVAILDDVLSLARIEKQSQTQEIDLQDGLLRPVLDAVVQRMTPAAEARRVRLLVDCPAGLTARFHAGLLDQAVANLVDNAVKYSPGGGEVRIEAAPEKGGVRIEVVDQGCGIEARHLPRLFERFYRADDSRSRATGGTGLGLAIVKHITTVHGGWTSVESKVGSGSRFGMHLPTARE